MRADDPLDRLLAAWNPRAPAAEEGLVAATMRAMRAERGHPEWRRRLLRLDEWVRSWLPSPNAALPAMGALVLGVALFHDARTTHRARETSAREWRDSVMQPASPLWIAAAHRDLTAPAERP
ncbi:MAG: hypothetical protein HUU04_10905 [Verrucomicrobiae bacterium]|nr:hypothetical protein [Verrucomicrobiae bacterium]